MSIVSLLANSITESMGQASVRMTRTICVMTSQLLPPPPGLVAQLFYHFYFFKTKNIDLHGLQIMAHIGEVTILICSLQQVPFEKGHP